MILSYFLPFPWQLSADCTGTNRGASRRIAFMPALRRFADNLPRTWHIIVLESIMAYFRVTTTQPRSCQNQFTVLYVWKFDRSIDRFLSSIVLAWQVTREILPRFFPCRFPFNHDPLRIHQALLPRGIGRSGTRILDKSPGSTYGKRRNKDFVVLQSACGALCASFVASSKPLYVCIFFRTNFLLNPV